jgi:hypothetical protein
MGLITVANVGLTIEDGIMGWFEGPEWDEVTKEVMERMAPGVQISAQTNAPWQDESGSARAGLTTAVVNQGGLVTMTLAHSVDYGVWLETIQNGRFAIILRTLEENMRDVMREVSLAVKQARKGRNL